MKRLFDIIVSGMGLLLVSPILLVVAVLVRIFVGSPILFSMARPGRYGQPFTMHKFRTMSLVRDMAGELLSDDQRLSRFGYFLRATSLDELPELWNVLRGDMSLVGPRPLLMEYLPLYTLEQARRHEVRPGITGWAQVNGRNAISWEEKFRLDVWYGDNHSIRLDLKILALTIVHVFSRTGINAPGEATMPRFSGSKEQEN